MNDLEQANLEIQGITLANLRGYSSVEWKRSITIDKTDEFGQYVLVARSEILRILAKAESLEPEESYWPGMAGMLNHVWIYDRWSPEDEISREFGRNAVAAFERGLEIETDRVGRTDFLYALIQVVLQVGEMDKAGEIAERLLVETELIAADSGWSPVLGDGKHLAHIVLGLIALSRDDRETAKDHLLASVETEGGGVLNSYGPRMDLAEALLKLGEAQVVILYLRFCASFWEMENGRLERWINQIEQGLTPDFGTNLHR
ncbi:tetratricopeptide repeat protein [Singulisphaera rosea]